MASQPLLEVRGLRAGYPSGGVLFGVDLTVERGEVHVLLGRNGAGKTSLLRTIAGLAPPRVSDGSIRVDGVEIVGLAPHRVARLGISLVPQGRRLFHSLTVRENLHIAERRGSGRWTIETVCELFPRLAERSNQPSGTLSGGEQQMLAIGRSLMTNPGLLLLDEPTEGLAPIVNNLILENLRTLKEEGQTVLFAEQNVDFALDIADRVSILGDAGQVAWTGSAASLSDDRTILTDLVGLGIPQSAG